MPLLNDCAAAWRIRTMIDWRFVRNFDDILASLKTERVEKETYLLAGETLVKIKLTAEKNETRGATGFSCAVVEIEGKKISDEEQQGKIAAIKLRGEPPTAEEQIKMVKEALGYWQIFDPPTRVSQGYADSHLKAIHLKEKLNKGGKIDVYI